MRHRTRNSTDTRPVRVLEAAASEYPPGHWNYSSNEFNTSFPRQINVEDMYDQIGQRRDAQGIPLTHLCHHTITRFSVNGASVFQFRHPSAATTTQTVSGFPGIAAYCADGGLPSYVGNIRGISGTPPPTDWEALRSRYYEAVDTFLPAEFLVGEDIAEHDVFVDAVKIALNPSRAVKTFVKNVGPLLKRFVRPTIRDAHEIARASSNTFLSYSFGVKPAIEDIKACIHAHRKVNTRLNFLKENRGKFVRVSVKAETYADNVRSDLSNNTYCTTYYTYSGKGTRQARIGCYGRVRHDMNHVGSWRAYAQYFGVEHIIGLAWELIPFSFVVDWVTNAQERLRNLTRLRLGGPFTELRGLWASEKLISQFDGFVAPGYGQGQYSGLVTSADSPTPVGEGIVTSFDRWLTIPDESHVLDFSQLGIFHILATGSLIIQRT